MQMYKVEKEDYLLFEDDFLFDKNSSMTHTNKSDQYMTGYHCHHNNKGPNMHMMKPDHCNPNQKHGYGGYHGNNYSETIYEQEEKQYHVNKNDNHHGGNNKNFYDHYHMSGMNHYGANKDGGYILEHERYYYSEERK